MSRPCPHCANGSTRRSNYHIEVLVIEEKQRLLRVLQRLIRTTTGRRFEPPLAGEVEALKVIIRQAREEGGLDCVLSLVGSLEMSVKVRQRWKHVAHQN